MRARNTAPGNLQVCQISMPGQTGTADTEIERPSIRNLGTAFSPTHYSWRINSSTRETQPRPICCVVLCRVLLLCGCCCRLCRVCRVCRVCVCCSPPHSPRSTSCVHSAWTWHSRMPPVRAQVTPVDLASTHPPVRTPDQFLEWWSPGFSCGYTPNRAVQCRPGRM